jgi:hypothetical protein
MKTELRAYLPLLKINHGPPRLRAAALPRVPLPIRRRLSRAQAFTGRLARTGSLGATAQAAAAAVRSFAAIR